MEGGFLACGRSPSICSFQRAVVKCRPFPVTLEGRRLLCSHQPQPLCHPAPGQLSARPAWAPAPGQHSACPAWAPTPDQHSACPAWAPAPGQLSARPAWALRTLSVRCCFTNETIQQVFFHLLGMQARFVSELSASR